MNSGRPGYRPRPTRAKMDAMLDAPPMTARVLIIEDDPNVAEVVARYLQREGFLVQTESDGRVGLEAALAQPPDLVILDLMLPSVGGLEICRRLRAVAPVAVIMLTARGEEADRIAGLELGADDYIAKPFSPRELTARVKAVLRRATGPLVGQVEPGVLRAGGGPLLSASGVSGGLTLGCLARPCWWWIPSLTRRVWTAAWRR